MLEREMPVYFGQRHIGKFVAVNWLGGSQPWSVEAVDDDGHIVRLEADTFSVEKGPIFRVTNGRCCDTTGPTEGA